MLRSALVLLLASCAATAPAAPVKDDLWFMRGCFIERRAVNETITVRFTPQLARPGVRVGDVLTYLGGPGVEHDRFELREEAGGFVFCPLDLGMPHGPPCQPAVVGDGPPPDPDSSWVRLTASDRHLRIAIESGETSSPIYDLRRDGCD